MLVLVSVLYLPLHFIIIDAIIMIIIIIIIIIIIVVVVFLYVQLIHKADDFMILLGIVLLMFLNCLLVPQV